jgi:hypothetical protein
MLTVEQMTSTAATPARSDRTTSPLTGRMDEVRAAELRAANINPHTGLATDYLNHFNEAIMLLEMVPDMPECAEDFLTWSPLSYAEHFWASNFKARDLAIEAYESADPKVRTDFDNLTATMTSILTAVGAAMREATQDKTRATLAEQAAAWVKPLVALAGGVINGSSESRVDAIMSAPLTA